MVKYFAILAKALGFWLALEHNDIICLWNVSSLSIVIPKSSSQGLDSTVEPSIFKLIFSYGLTKNWLLPEFAISLLFLNQANVLLMVGSKSPESLDPGIPVCQLKYMWNKHTKNETMRITLSPGI